MEKEIIEGNKLIAEFMKAEQHTPYWVNLRAGVRGEYYHSSWNWLMPVVEKIGKIGIPDDKYESGERIYVDNYYPRTFGMMDNKGENYLFRLNGFTVHESKTLIGSVYLGVIEFIKWHNEHKSPSQKEGTENHR